MSLPYHHSDLQAALAALRGGGVILYPTDTVWGLGCDATNPQAVRKVYEIKGRDFAKPMSLLVDSVERVKEYALIPDTAVAEALWRMSPQPTIIYPGFRHLPPQVAAGGKSIGIRITSEAFSQALCREFGKPIVSTSANISSQPTPEIFHEIAPEIVGAVDYTVNYRRDDFTRRQPSTIVCLNADGTFKVLRGTLPTSKTVPLC